MQSSSHKKPSGDYRLNVIKVLWTNNSIHMIRLQTVTGRKRNREIHLDRRDIVLAMHDEARSMINYVVGRGLVLSKGLEDFSTVQMVRG